MAPEKCLMSDIFHQVISLEATLVQAEEFENEKTIWESGVRKK